MREAFEGRFEAADARFEAIETALRDMAQQLVVLGRGIKVALEHRANIDSQVEDHERRIASIEKRLPG